MLRGPSPCRVGCKKDMLNFTEIEIVGGRIDALASPALRHVRPARAARISLPPGVPGVRGGPPAARGMEKLKQFWRIEKMGFWQKIKKWMESKDGTPLARSAGVSDPDALELRRAPGTCCPDCPDCHHHKRNKGEPYPCGGRMAKGRRSK